jgi:hypothetical protein
MPGKFSSMPSEKLEQARLLYDGGVTPIPEILKLLGVSQKAFYRYRVEHNWPMREPPTRPNYRRTQAAPGATAPPRPATGPSDARALIARLEEAVTQEFTRVEAALGKKAPRSVEQSARALASLVRSLAELKRLRRDSEFETVNARDDDDANGADAESSDRPPRELAELRAELARRLERLGRAGPAD